MAVERRIQKLVLLSVFSISLVVTPWANLDPINLPKLLVLGSCSFALLGNFALYLKVIIDSELRLVTFCIAFFLIALVIVMLMSDSGIWPQVYGVFGRNTGLLSYLSLAIFFLSLALVSNTKFIKRLVWIFISTGICNVVYGIFQWLDVDPVNWSNPYNPIVGTFGNPNFVSAHLGMTAIATLALLVEKGKSVGNQAVFVFYLIASLLVIQKSNSSQGLLIFVLGASVIAYFGFFRNLRSTIRSTYVSLCLGLFTFGLFGVLNKGPLASILYQESVTYRGDYWRAGLKMTLDNPFFGVGLDSYGDWYRYSRTEAAVQRRGPDVVSNSAHNVFLDISSNGGLFLLTAYLLIIGLVSRSAWRLLRRQSDYDGVKVGLVVVWLAYLVQSTISINQIGLAVWGWVLGGAVIGLDLSREEPQPPKPKGRADKRQNQVPANVVLIGTLGFALGFAISVWPMTQDVNFRKALEEGNGSKIYQVPRQFPRNIYYLSYASQILIANNADDKALDLTKMALASNPRDFNSWRVLLSNPQLNASEKATAIARMKELDPLNFTLNRQ